MIKYDSKTNTASGGTSIITIALVVLSILINLTDMNVIQMNWRNFANGSLYSWLSFMENGVFHFGGLLLAIWTVTWMSLVVALPILFIVALVGFILKLVFTRKL